MTNKEQYDNLCQIITTSQNMSDTFESIGLNVDSVTNKNGVGDFISKINDTAMKLILNLLNYCADDEDTLYEMIYSACITQDYNTLNEMWNQNGFE